MTNIPFKSTLLSRRKLLLSSGALLGVLAQTQRAFATTYDRELPVPVLQGRSVVDYWTPDAISVSVPGGLIMAGFRWAGQYRKTTGRLVSTGIRDGRVIIKPRGAAVTERVPRAHNWYAVFAVANSWADTCDFVIIPFLRVRSIRKNTIRLGQAGERQHLPLEPQRYAFQEDGLAGADCLVITEDERFSGRITRITGNSAGRVRLENAGRLRPGDFILPAPPDSDDYVYLCSYYNETENGEARNIADSGYRVMSYMNAVHDAHFPPQPGVAKWQKVDLRGYISPLARGVILRDKASFSTSAKGDYGAVFGHDGGNHVVDGHYHVKSETTTRTFIDYGIEIAFSRAQYVFYKNTGSLISQKSLGQMFVHGWMEP